MNTLFSHVCVVTMDERMSVWTDAFVGVTDGKISYLSKHAPEEKPARPARKPAPVPEETPALTLEAEVPASPALDAAEPAPEQKETL